jgi:hypothetical protein
MSNNNKKTYDIGYGKPPVATRFPKGKSGNPKGRPPGSLNMAAKLRAALTEQVTVTEDGKRKKISKADAMFKQLVNKAAAGDTRAIKLVFELAQKAKDPEGFGQTIQIVMDEADARLL